MMERATVSANNPYYISKHRKYELMHFCRQYNEWKKELNSLSFVISGRLGRPVGSEWTNTTEKLVELRDSYRSKMELVESSCVESDPCIGRYIFIAVTEGFSYDVLRARMNVPCNRAMYYDYLRKFYWILSQKKQPL